MKKITAALLAVAGAGIANAQLLNVYDSTPNYTGSYFAPGGATSQTSNTRMVADEFTIDPIFQGKQATKLAFTIINANNAAIHFRGRVRVYSDNAGAPGLYAFGFSFQLAQTALSASTWTADISANNVFLPAGSKAWFGITFDSVNTTIAGYTRASTAQINNLGWGLATQGVGGNARGTSDVNKAFLSTAPTSGLFDNIAGSNLTFTGNPAPASNFSFGVQAVPEPSTYAAMALGLAVVIRRRRK